MKKNSITQKIIVQGILFLLFSLSSTVCFPDTPSNDPLRIGIIGDQTGTDNIEAAYSALEKGVDILSKQHIEMALHFGDIGESREPEKTYVHFTMTNLKQHWMGSGIITGVSCKQIYVYRF
ncbi:hypothetical protein [Desulfobacula sp.]|uniref:hypothetical protein n=1 Tax=Desulfobacula sp. TaxID=2593537 RepID=UPI00262D56E9|nr:hypothetical protein [Desulfobacula sp.]